MRVCCSNAVHKDAKFGWIGGSGGWRITMELIIRVLFSSPNVKLDGRIMNEENGEACSTHGEIAVHKTFYNRKP